MQLVRSLKEIFKKLVNTPFWPFVAIVASIQQSLKFFTIVRIWRDHDGDWYNKRQGICLYSPTLNVDTLNEIEKRVKDFWLHNFDISKPKILIDIGAGIGEESLYLSKVINLDAKLYAIEAHPRTYRCLKKTIDKNNIENVFPIHAAVTKEDTSILISSSSSEHLSNNIFQSTQSKTESVPGITLESLVKKLAINKVDFIKINIEGAEYDALIGGLSIVQSNTHFVVSCHDFKYLEGQGKIFKTFDKTAKLFRDNNRDVYSRKDDYRREVPFYLYTNENN